MEISQTLAATKQLPVERGWTLKSGVYQMLQPLMLSSFITPAEQIEEYFARERHANSLPEVPGFARFSGVDHKVARKLLDTLPAWALKDRQNRAPSCEELLNLCVTYPSKIELGGYYIGPQRFDERITLDSIHICESLIDASREFKPVSESCETLETRKCLSLSELAANADELSVCESFKLGNRVLRMWWD